MSNPEIWLIAALNLYVALRYMRQNIGPDEAIWLLWGVTGARPYYDFWDCKPPGIFLWMKLLGLITGGRWQWMKLLHHIAVGVGCIGVYLYTGSLGAALLATAVLQSAWFFAFQSWIDAISGLFLLLMCVAPPWAAAIYAALACFFSVKSGPPAAIVLFGYGYFIPTAVVAGIGFLAIAGLALVNMDLLRRIWYGTFEIPRRMAKHRIPLLWTNYLATPLLLVIPLVMLSIYAGISPVILLACASYAILNTFGRVWRSNHMLPLAMLAACLPSPGLAALYLLFEMVSAGFYLGDVWVTVYPNIVGPLVTSRALGEELASQKGTLWVNNWWTQIYIYARKRPFYGARQMEITGIIEETVKPELQRVIDNPPDVIVLGPGGAQVDVPRHYHNIGKIPPFEVLG